MLPSPRSYFERLSAGRRALNFFEQIVDSQLRPIQSATSSRDAHVEEREIYMSGSLHRATEAAKAPSHQKKGRLVGWLVSYGLSDSGKSYEIRSGRSFIGSSDEGISRAITVNESSIDSPHLAIKASQKHRVHILDVFSRAGSFVRRGDSDSETKIDGSTEVGHGDWIRIGNSVRFQVCLVESNGR